MRTNVHCICWSQASPDNWGCIIFGNFCVMELSYDKFSWERPHTMLMLIVHMRFRSCHRLRNYFYNKKFQIYSSVDYFWNWSTYHSVWTKLQKIPDTLLGAILGYAACSPVPKVDPDDDEYNSYPMNMNALSISFDSVGYGTTLARTFNWVHKTCMTQCHVQLNWCRVGNFGKVFEFGNLANSLKVTKFKIPNLTLMHVHVWCWSFRSPNLNTKQEPFCQI